MAFKFLGVSPLSEFEWIKRQKKEGVLISYAQYLAGHFRGALLETAEVLKDFGESKTPYDFWGKYEPYGFGGSLPMTQKLKEMLRVSAGETK